MNRLNSGLNQNFVYFSMNYFMYMYIIMGF